MRRVAVFLDAGYFWVQVSALILGARGARNAISLDFSNMRTAVLQEVASQFPSANLLRVYWYDGPGPSGKTPEHNAIESLDDFKLRLGTRNGVGQQKAVDGLIIADMVSLTQSKAITDALLISGDADMTPGVVAAQAMGLRVHLLSIGAPTATSPHLAAEVDRKAAWTHAEVGQFAQPRLQATTPAPSTTGAPATPSQASVPNLSAQQQSPPATPPSAPAQTGAVQAFPCQAIAQSAHANIQVGPHASTLAGLSQGVVQLPPEIDRALLSAARQQVGRPLSEREKRRLRTEFKKLL